ncbi:HEPN domain-containing protein [Alteromonas sp.]|nr:HEPN domain-containing protein [Alteromonas sp.]
MAVEGKDFLEFAKSAVSHGTEIGFRNAVSRSYYSIYHTVLSLVEQQIPNYAGGGTHSSLIKYLEDPSCPERFDKRQLRRLSYILRQQRDLRCDADYELDVDTITETTAEDCIEQAMKVCSICQSLSSQAA